MAGLTFGSWVVVEKSGNSPRGMALWRCICKCGNENVVGGSDLRSGKSRSCGCEGSRSRIQQLTTTHGMTGTRLYNCWKNMRARCDDLEKEHYGAKGIKVCDEWQSFEPFKCWALSNGYDANLTIERLNNDLGYQPSNCTWASKKTQARNRSIVNMAPDGRSWAEIAESNGISAGILNNRVSAGKWTHELAATWPIGQRRAAINRNALGQIVESPQKLWRR